jgi:hypothetical protein
VVYLMSLCDFCTKEVKYTFICPECGGHFCKEHRKPEDHNCIKNKPAKKDPVEKKILPQIIDISQNEPLQEHDNIEYYNIEELVFSEKKTAESKNITVLIKSFIDQIETIKIPLAILIALSLFSGVAMGSLIYPNGDSDNLQQRYDTLYEYYTNLLNSTQKLEMYYDNLTMQYSEVREEYTLLNSLYSDLIQTNSELNKEYNDILSYKKNITLASKQTITILPKQNHTLIYDIPFSGYMTLNYTANSETYVWVGSTTIEPTFYTRNPQFPHTSNENNFTVPVKPDIIVYFANPDEFLSMEITFWISFTY